MKLKLKVKVDDNGQVKELLFPTGTHVDPTQGNTYVTYTAAYKHRRKTRFILGMCVLAKTWKKWPTIEVDIPDEVSGAR